MLFRVFTGKIRFMPILTCGWCNIPLPQAVDDWFDLGLLPRLPTPPCLCNIIFSVADLFNFPDRLLFSLNYSDEISEVLCSVASPAGKSKRAEPMFFFVVCPRFAGYWQVFWRFAQCLADAQSYLRFWPPDKGLR